MKLLKFLFISVFFAVYSLGISGLAQAEGYVPVKPGRYELVKGMGIAVCEVYGRSLNASGETWPMNCERKVLPEFAKEGLTKPVWRKLDAVRHFDLVVDVDKLLEPSLYRSPYTEKQIAQRVADMKVFAETSLDLKIADIDINNDGSIDSTIKYNDRCAPPGSGGWWAIPLLVADSSLKSVDHPKSRPLLQNGTDQPIRYPAGAWRYVMYDVFLFKGKSYFDRWSDSKEDTDILRVFHAEGNHATEICKYEYRYSH